MNRIWQALDLLRLAEALHGERMALHALALHRRIQLPAERIVSQDADGEGRAGRRKGLRRPFDELREVEEEHRLDLVFAGCGSGGE